MLLLVLAPSTARADAAAPSGPPAIPAQWLQSQVPESVSVGIQDGSGWWRIFRDPTLDRFEARALVGNRDVLAALAVAREAQANARIMAAPLYPSVSAAATYGRGTQSGTGARGVELYGAFDPDISGANHATRNSARGAAQASQDDAAMASVDLSIAVASTYFELIGLSQRIHLAGKIADDASRLLSLIEAQKRLGAVSDLDVEQQRNATAAFAAAVPALERLAAADRHLLATLTGEAPSADALPSINLDTLPLPAAQPVSPAAFLAGRPDVAAAERRMAAARFDVSAARAALLPHLSLALDGGLGADSAQSLTPGGLIGGLLAQLAQPIVQGGALRGKVRFSRAKLEEMTQRYRQVMISALRSVEDGLSDQDRLFAYERETDVAVQSAQHAQTLAEARVRLGNADFTTLLLTQRALYQAEDTRLQIRQQRLTVLARLLAACSGSQLPSAPVTTPALSSPSYAR